MTDEEKKQLEERIAKLRAEDKVREARREQREAERRQREEAEWLALKSQVDDALERLVNEGFELEDNLARVDCSYPSGHVFGVVLLKAPPPLLWRGFEKSMPEAKGTKKDELRFKLVQACLAWPAYSVVEGYMEKQPHNLQRFVDAIAVLAGAKTEEVLGKS